MIMGRVAYDFGNATSAFCRDQPASGERTLGLTKMIGNYGPNIKLTSSDTVHVRVTGC